MGAESNGRTPVREFLEGLDLQTQARPRSAIDLLIHRNVQAREPLVRHLEGKLWELRVESGASIYRVVYFFATGRRIVLLHGFQKKTQETPRREIETATRRFEAFQARQGV